MKKFEWKELSIASSEMCFNEYCTSNLFDCPEEFRTLRDELCGLFSETLAEIGIDPSRIRTDNNAYKTDYLFGLRLYELFTVKYGMDVRSAANSGIWRYLSLKVIPDIVEQRYGITHPDRFWKKPKRIWLRVIWWYIYLSWQGTAEKTERAIADNSTDEILQLVDRCGKGGYRVELYRAIMRQYSMLDVHERRKSNVFRKMLVLNTARVQVIEPELAENGVTGYVDCLYNYLTRD